MLNWSESVRVSELAGEVQPLFQISQSYLLRVKDSARKMEGSGTVLALYVFQVSCDEKFHSPQPQPASPHYRPQEVSLEV